MNQNIYAYTELNYLTYPAYISVNKRHGKYWITVRSPDSSNTAEVEMPFTEMLKLGEACTGVLNLGEK